MARQPRQIRGGHYYHVMNRGNGRQTVFHQPEDYRAFLGFLGEAQRRVKIGVLAVCLMPNHFHMVLRPTRARDLSRWMHWVMTKQVVRHRRVHETVGHIWQDRFKPFEIRSDGYLISVMRYVERNALRAGLVKSAEQWLWGSLAWRCTGDGPVRLTDPPYGLPEGWVARVNGPETAAELEALRKCAKTGEPLGSPDHAPSVGTVPN